MATIREYFDTDARALTVHGNWMLVANDGHVQAEVVAKIAYDFEANAKYWYFYVPANVDISKCLGVLFNTEYFQNCQLDQRGMVFMWRSGIRTTLNANPP